MAHRDDNGLWLKDRFQPGKHDSRHACVTRHPEFGWQATVVTTRGAVFLGWFATERAAAQRYADYVETQVAVALRRMG